MISYNEFQAARGKLEDYGLSSNWDDVLAKVDTDGNGTISYEEFYTAAVDRSKIVTEESIENAFKLFDLNGDGSIEIQEFMKCLPSEEFGRCASDSKYRDRAKSITSHNRDNEKWAQILKEGWCHLR